MRPTATHATAAGAVRPQPVLGTGPQRLEGREKVTGTARYATEQPHNPPDCAYAWPVPAAVAAGRITGVDTSAALALPGTLAVLTPDDAPRVAEGDDPILAVLQDHEVPHRGWFVALAVADSLENARAAAAAVRVSYEARPADVELRADHPDAFVPDSANGHPGRRERGDAPEAYAAAPVRVETAYTIPPLHNHPMEPHSSYARWDGDHLTVYDSSQGAHWVRSALAKLFALAPEQITVVSEHVGGGFGSKGTPRPHVVLAAMAARHTGRPVKLALPRRQMAEVVGYRSPTLHTLKLGADRDGTLLSVEHEMTAQTSRIKDFIEHGAVAARVMYAVPHSLTTHRAVRLDVPSPSWMRAPGEAPSMYALESAMDELATELGMDPIELRLRNEPVTEPDSGLPFSSRHLTECLREGARRFGWHHRDPRPAVRREGDLLTGTGVAAATYPVLCDASSASATARPDGGYTVRVDATDIGTGARTVLAQVAADALGVPLDAVRIEIGSTRLPYGPLAGGSAGTASWGWAVHDACTALTSRLAGHRGPLPDGGLTAESDTTEAAGAKPAFARHAFGAHFAEVQVDTVSGEVRVRRMLGVYAAGRILNSRTARSQSIGGMTMGLGMALTEHSTADPVLGGFAERDLASYHVPAHADVPDIDAHWVDETDTHLGPLGAKGIGEIGIVGAPAAVGNAVHHALGVRLRDLPLTPDKVLAALG
ncbi:xanthine dehydrogenase family protein molybdopterin-binding subunit [Streptomyces sp. ODS05-4]|uniref:xanthine dehydrogenase family protein molybdopterin-binding subunit n=1 Tax=Streptomyces sp. ODS05-4 TaxID=2944939 RepID=UPI00210F088E|nr:xanthine dehydrogenase family protein molybdopterin-binding subunit [Streptomyces sp. ODS05-4]